MNKNILTTLIFSFILLFAAGCNQTTSTESYISSDEENIEVISESETVEPNSEELISEEVTSENANLSEDIDVDVIEKILLPKAVYYYENPTKNYADIRVAETYYAFAYPAGETPTRDWSDDVDELGCYLVYVDGDIFRMMLETMQKYPLVDDENSVIENRVDYDEILDRYILHMGDGAPYQIEITNTQLDTENQTITVEYDLICGNEEMGQSEDKVACGTALLVPNTNELAESMGYIYMVRGFTDRKQENTVAQTSSQQGVQQQSTANNVDNTTCWIGSDNRYHSTNYCEKVDPLQTIQTTVSGAEGCGYGKCPECW